MVAVWLTHDHLAGARLVIIGHSLADPDIRDIVNRAANINARAETGGQIILLLYTEDSNRASLFEMRGLTVCGAVGGSSDVARWARPLGLLIEYRCWTHCRIECVANLRKRLRLACWSIASTSSCSRTAIRSLSEPISCSISLIAVRGSRVMLATISLSRCTPSGVWLARVRISDRLSRCGRPLSSRCSGSSLFRSARRVFDLKSKIQVL
jgi:hypothetical protein